MTKRFAFTLAEVLIALAIIGVVAAMTIPTFMANTAGAQFRTGFKKGITVLTQAASANYATEGYDFSGTNGFVANADHTPADANAIIGFNTSSDTAADTTSDMFPDTPSLFHLFQNNLNMKNSNELVNYAVMPADISLSCAGNADTQVTYSIPGQADAGEGENDENNADSAADALDTRPVANAAATGSGGLDTTLCGGRTIANGGINQGRMFQLEDGMVFTYDNAQAYCSESNPCYGYLDVNGPQGPNRVISCSAEVTDGDTGNLDGWIPSYGRNADPGSLLADCTVESKDITDIYPVLFYGSAVKPASRAAKAVLYSKRSNQTQAPQQPATDGNG